MTDLKLRLSWLDRVAMFFSPAWGLKRVKARATAQLMARHYEAASTGRRAAGWHRRSTDPNAADGPSLASLRELSRDLKRNNGWARRGIRTIKNNVVGRGIVAKAIDRGPNGQPIPRATQRQRTQQAIWSEWAKNPMCDYDGRLPFSGLQRLVMETVAESGEALVVREAANAGDGLAVPIRLRVLEPDYLDTLRDGLVGPGGGPIVNGIELDQQGRRVAYWLFTQHPGALTLFGNRFESRRVPADRVLHVYEVERPSQMRGVAWLASAIAKLHDFDDFEDAELMQQKIAACFGAFVVDLDGSAVPLGTLESDEQPGGDPLIEALEPGQIEYLPPGKDIKFAAPPTPSGTDFTARQLRRVAASLGVTYEDLSGDFSQVNFSSARMARLAHWANVHSWRWNMLIPQMLEPVWGWVMGTAAALNQWPSVPAATWTAPPMPILEPEKAGLAITRLVRSGAQSLPEAIRERGNDPEQHLLEIQESNELLDKLGIVLDSDPRHTNGSGGAQSAGATAEPEPEPTPAADDEAPDDDLEDDAEAEVDEDEDTAAA